MYGYDDSVNRYYQRWQQLSSLPQARKWAEPHTDDIHSTFLPTTLTEDEKWTALHEILYARKVLHSIPLATSYHTRTLYTLRIYYRSQPYRTLVLLLRLVTSVGHHGSNAIPTGSTVPRRLTLRMGPQKRVPSTATATSQRQIQTISHDHRTKKSTLV